MNAPTLRPYQSQALEAVVAARATGLNRLLVKKPTGTGKTVMFAAMLRWPGLAAWLEGLPKSKGARMLVIAHREELLDQALEKIQHANPGLMVSIEQGDRHANSYSDVIIASIQTLAAMKFRRLKRLLLRHEFRIVIVDEAHHAAAASYRTALVHLGFLPPADASDSSDIEAANHEDLEEMQKALDGWDVAAPKDRLLVGVTATPNRSDAIGLGCVFQSLAYNYGLKDAIDDGWLTTITPWAVETADNLDQVRTVAGEFNQRDLADVVNNEARNKAAVKGWLEKAEGLPTIAFTVDVAHAHSLAEEFQRAGIKAEAVSGETPKDTRRGILDAYRRGDIMVLCNCMILTEGTDLPLTACILHAKPTKSATLYEQMTGRGLRPLPGDPVGPERLTFTGQLRKPECIVIDVVDVTRRHSLQTVPVLYGLPPGLVAKDKNLRQLADEFERFQEKYPGFDIGEGRQTLEQLRIRAERIDVWAVPSLGAFGNGRALSWMKAAEDDFRISYPWKDGNETLRVGRDLVGNFEIVCSIRPANKEEPTRSRVLANGITTADAAAGVAEAFILQERRSVTKLKDTSAPWRSNPASEKQVGALRRMRVPVKAGLTAGEASDLIDLAIARRGRR